MATNHFPFNIKYTDLHCKYSKLEYVVQSYEVKARYFILTSDHRLIYTSLADTPAKAEVMAQKFIITKESHERPTKKPYLYRKP